MNTISSLPVRRAPSAANSRVALDKAIYRAPKAVHRDTDWRHAFLPAKWTEPRAMRSLWRPMPKWPTANRSSDTPIDRVVKQPAKARPQPIARTSAVIFLRMPGPAGTGEGKKVLFNDDAAVRQYIGQSRDCIQFPVKTKREALHKRSIQRTDITSGPSNPGNITAIATYRALLEGGFSTTQIESALRDHGFQEREIAEARRLAS